MAVVLDLVMPDVELAIKAIDIRNNIVHEGYNPPEDAEKYLKALLTTAAALLPNPHVKFPSDTWANKLEADKKI